MPPRASRYNKVTMRPSTGRNCSGAISPRRAVLGAAGGVHRRDHREVQSVLPDVPARNAQAAQRRHDGRIFERLVRGSRATGRAHDADRLGEPFLDPKIFDRIEYCDRHSISTLLSTNGTLLDGSARERCSTPPRAHHVELRRLHERSFEYYRKGARFEKVRDNFVRFARMKKERRRSCRSSCRWCAWSGTRTRWTTSSGSGAPSRASTRCASRKTRPT